MKKMISLTFFAFTPVYGPYVEEKVMTAETWEDGPDFGFACKGLYSIMKTDLVMTR